jgi:hypothetical protein
MNTVIAVCAGRDERFTGITDTPRLPNVLALKLEA